MYMPRCGDVDQRPDTERQAAAPVIQICVPCELFHHAPADVQNDGSRAAVSPGAVTLLRLMIRADTSGRIAKDRSSALGGRVPGRVAGHLLSAREHAP